MLMGYPINKQIKVDIKARDKEFKKDLNVVKDQKK